MALERKPNPVNEDTAIDKIQVALYKGLVTNGTWTNYESYHRAHKNETPNGIRPEIFRGTARGNDFWDAFNNDEFNATSFFLIPDNIPEENGMRTANISIIFQVNLEKLYPSAPHLFDAEMHMEVESILKKLDGTFTFIDTHTSIEGVYEGLDTSKVQWDNMQKFHVVRFEIEAKYVGQSCAVFATKNCTIKIDRIETTYESVAGANDGTATVFPILDQGNLTYLWDDPAEQTTATATGLGAGAYTVIVSDDNEIGCNATKSVTIEVAPPPPTCGLLLDDLVVTGTTISANDGTATVVFSGDVGQLNFLWSENAGSQVTQTATNLPLGTVSVTVSDSGVGATCMRIKLGIIANLNVRYLFLDGFNDYLLFDATLTISSPWTMQIEFFVNSFASLRTITSNSTADLILIKSDTVIDVKFANQVRDFTVPTMSINTFYHLAIRDNGTDLQLYLNGVESSTGALAGGRIFTARRLGATSTGSLVLGGGFDNFALVPLAISDAKIVTIANKPSTFLAEFPTADIVYDLNESGTDTIVLDSSSNNRNAVAKNHLSGAPKWEDR
jgi:hypothetical protein